VGKIEDQWSASLTRRRALSGLAGFLAGSQLLHAQEDLYPLRDHHRALGLNEMMTVFDFEPVFHANVPLSVFDFTAHGGESEFTVRRNRRRLNGWIWFPEPQWTPVGLILRQRYSGRRWHIRSWWPQPV
jgi:hypothetical protein